MTSSNYRTFFLFIAFTLAAAVLWFLFRYNNIYEEYVNVTVEWTNVPADLSLSNASRNPQVPVKIKASGFQLLWLQYTDISVPLEFESHVTLTEEDRLIFNPEPARSALDRAIGKGITIVEIDAAAVALNYERFASKIVPVLKDFKISFEGNYKELKPIGFNVDSIKVTGNDAFIKSMSALKVKIDDVKVNDSLIVKNIDLTALYPEVKLEPNNITYTINAAQMTEGSFKLPVKLINRKNNNTIQVIPDVVNVVFVSRLYDYESIAKTDFKVTVDVSKIKTGETTTIPELTYDNDKIHTARIQPQSVQLLIIQ